METWYVTEDGVAVAPNEVAPDKSGVLRHKSGAAIAMRGEVPSTRGVNPDEERAPPRGKPKAAVLEEPKADPASKDMKAEATPKPYKTRETKSE